MKKVIVSAALLSLMAAPALADVVNSPHNLANTSSNAIETTTVSYDQVCVFCHTPHGGQNGSTVGYLWNRSNALANLAAADLYDSGSLHTDSKPAAVETEVARSDARLCLTCHDGSNLADGSGVGSSLRNPAGQFGAVQPAFAGGADAVRAYADIGDASGKDLTNDHPIGMDYGVVQTAKPTEFNAGPALKFFTNAGATSNDIMWCSTCHNPHDNTTAPFLRVSNASSGLCTTCHIK